MDKGKYILWEHFVNVFEYDQGEMSLSYHEKLTLNHFQLDPASKMRNKLAEDVLDKNMLNLMKVLNCNRNCILGELTKDEVQGK